MSETTDLLVVGGGPAGLAAAVEARAAGLDVVLVDERPTLGGQIFKQPGPGFRVLRPSTLGRDFARGRRLIDAAEASGAHVLLATSAVTLRQGQVVIVADGGQAQTVTARRIVVAPGAHDRPVVFPGWTLPGVITAGAAQSLVKTQRVVPGERIVFAGSGPLALAFPAQLCHYGAGVVLALEAGPGPGVGDVLRIGAAGRGNLSLLRDAAGYRWELARRRVPLRYGRIVVRTEGEGRVEQVVHAAVGADWRVVAGTEETITADTVCIGYGFLPSVELLRLAGCEFAYDEDLGGTVVRVDEWMRTSTQGVSAAGDGTGVAGSFVAADEGRLAALGAAVDLETLSLEEAHRRAAPIRARLRRKETFRQALRPLHAVGDGIYELAAPDTVVCRCEEVTRAQLDAAIDSSPDIDVVKSFTRVTMGLCQGKTCQRQIAAMVARRHRLPVAAVSLPTPRSPARPVALGAIADDAVEDLGLFVE